MKSFRFVVTIRSMTRGSRGRNLRTHRVLLHHGLRIATARCAAMLLGELMMLLRRAIVRLMELSVRSSHRSHGSRLHLIHLRSWRTCLHIHHGWLLVVTLLRTLVAHHRSTWSWARKSIRSGTWHVPGVLWIRRSRSRRVHLHLRISWHLHKGSIRWLIDHHLASHGRSLSTDKLTAGRSSHGHVLYVRTHSILRLDLLWKTGHLLRLSTIHIRRHRSR